MNFFLKYGSYLFKGILLVGLLFSFFYIVKYWPSSELWEKILHRAMLFPLCSLIACFIVSRILFAIRWYTLINRKIRTSLLEVLIEYGWFHSLITFTPFRIGELYRINWIKQKGESNSWGTGIFLIERLFDLITIFTIGLISVLSFPDISKFLSNWIYILFTTIILFYFVCSGLFFNKSLLWVISRLQKYFNLGSMSALVMEKMNLLAIGLTTIRNYKINFICLLATFVIWSVQGLGYKYYFSFFFLSISWIDSMMIVSMVALSSLITVLPGNLGIFEAVMIFTLGILGEEVHMAVLATLGLRFVTVVFNLFYGMLCYFLKKIYIQDRKMGAQ